MSDFGVKIPVLPVAPLIDSSGQPQSAEFLNAVSQTRAAWSSVYWAEVSAWAAIAAALLTFFALMFAIRTVDNWRQQVVAERTFAQSLEALQALTQVKRLLNDIAFYFPSVNAAWTPATSAKGQEYRIKLGEAFLSLERATVGLDEFWPGFKEKREFLRRICLEVSEAVVLQYERSGGTPLTPRQLVLLDINQWGGGIAQVRQDVLKERNEKVDAVEKFLRKTIRDTLPQRRT